MIELRRRMLKGGTAALIAPWIGSGLLVPRTVIAAEWNRQAFAANNVNDALKAWGATPFESRDVVLQAPEIAENGSKVEIEVTSNLANTRSIAVFADRNPTPLCAALDFSGPALPYSRLQIKLAETTRLRAVVKTSDGKSHVAFREVKVTLGGCGG